MEGRVDAKRREVQRTTPSVTRQVGSSKYKRVDLRSQREVRWSAQPRHCRASALRNRTRLPFLLPLCWHYEGKHEKLQ